MNVLSSTRFLFACFIVVVLFFLSTSASSVYAIPPSVGGDCNDDGVVDGADFLCWQRGLSSPPLDLAYLENWRQFYGSFATLSNLAQFASPTTQIVSRSVPEPGALILAGLMVLLAPGRIGSR